MLVALEVSTAAVGRSFKGTEHQDRTPSRVRELDFQSHPHSSPGFQQVPVKSAAVGEDKANRQRSVLWPFVRWVFMGPTLCQDCPKHWDTAVHMTDRAVSVLLESVKGKKNEPRRD